MQGYQVKNADEDRNRQAGIGIPEGDQKRNSVADRRESVSPDISPDSI
jgi:hypothetical protein